jgi:hypothetical protein
LSNKPPPHGSASGSDFSPRNSPPRMPRRIQSGSGNSRTAVRTDFVSSPKCSANSNDSKARRAAMDLMSEKQRCSGTSSACTSATLGVAQDSSRDKCSRKDACTGPDNSTDLDPNRASASETFSAEECPDDLQGRVRARCKLEIQPQCSSKLASRRRAFFLRRQNLSTEGSVLLVQSR